MTSQPWFAPFNTALCCAVLSVIAQGKDARAILNDALHGKSNAQGLPLQCVAHSELPSGTAYETHIYATGHIPTRNQPHSKGALHDACNALMWVHYPQTKSVLNAIQAMVIAQDGVQGQRGKLRDALTLFDESALILCCPRGDAAPQQLAQRRWRELLHDRRSDWHSDLQPFIFGHALLQKLQHPYPAITAQVWVLEGLQKGGLQTKGAQAQELQTQTQQTQTVKTQNQLAIDIKAINIAAVDAALASSVLSAYKAAQLSKQALLPLPVLGIASWCAANESAAFYDNATVFRAP